jgi:hypothetical protein
MQKTTVTAIQNPLSLEPRTPQGMRVQWQQTAVMRNAQQQEEAFSIGPDGRVWSFIADHGDSRLDACGQRLESLGMEADFLTVGRNVAGALVVIAAKGLHTRYRTEMPLTALDIARGLGRRWSPAQSIHLPTIQGAIGVRRMYTQSDFNGMRVAIVVDTEHPGGGTSYVMLCSQWDHTGPKPFILLPALTVSTAVPDSKPAGNSVRPRVHVAQTT